MLASIEGGISLYKVSSDLLKIANPDVILTQMLCEVCAATPKEVEAAVCQALPSRPKIVNLEPSNIIEIGDSIEQVANACGVPERGKVARDKFMCDMKSVSDAVNMQTEQPSVLLLEWLDPPFDGGHWVIQQITNAGATAAWGGKPGDKSKARCWDDVVAASPDVVLIACCGFDLARNIKDARKNMEGKLDRLRGSRIYAVDGNRYFARPSPSVASGSAIVARCAFDGQRDVVAKLEALPFMPKEGEGWSRLL